MKKFTLQYITALFALLLAFSACLHDDFNAGTELPDGVKAIEFSMEVQNQSAGKSSFRSATSGAAATRALGTEPGDEYESAYPTDLNENIIDNVEVFLFNVDGSLKRHAKGTELQKNGNEDRATLRVLIPNTEVSQYEGQSFRIVVVANATVSIPTPTTFADLQNMVQETATINANPGAPQTKFLMDGEINSQNVNWGTSATYNVPGELPLRRAAAKVRLRIKDVNVNVTQNAQTVHYEMEGEPRVKLVHYTEKTSLLQGAPYTISSGDWKSSEYRSMALRVFDGKINDTDPNNPTNTFLSANLPFYAYENDWSANNSADETYLTVEIRFKAQIGGTAENPVYGPVKPYYYRIPINYRMPLPNMDDDEIAGLYKMQRNHLYDIVSFIGVLGSEDEGEPFEVEAYVAIQPWNEPDAVDGSIRNAHFLVVKELHPLMPNINTRVVGYLSNLPIKSATTGGNDIQIEKTVFEYYDQAGDLYVFTDNGTNVVATKNGEYFNTFNYGQSYNGQTFTRFGGATVTFDETNELDKKLIINHDIPNNYVPYDIYFRVQHVEVEGESGEPLYKDVRVTQYPPKYVTGTKSPGLGGGNNSNADFRFHDTLGSRTTDPATGQPGTQKNDVFYKITTVVNAGDEKIGDPTDANGRTLRDGVSNQLISPEFIIASQHGMAINISQYSGGSASWINSPFGAGFGPYSSRFPDRSPYNDPDEYIYDGSNQTQSIRRSYTDAGDRCYNYFEGEYGTDGNYTEYYLDTRGRQTSRTVYKTFKYQGRWRIPTEAELKYIDGIQDAPTSAVKSLLWGQYYWSARTNYAYNFFSNQWSTTTPNAPVRCVFDTYKVND